MAESADQQNGVRTRGSARVLAVFLVIAFGLAWLLALPLWLGEGLESPLAQPLMGAMMFAPALAALVAVFALERPRNAADALGLIPRRPAGRFIGWLALGLLLPLAFSLGALPVGAALGLYSADFTGFSGFRQLLAEQSAALGVEPPDLPIGLLVAGQFLNFLLGALLLNIVPALGEEIGWRGWLLPRLLERTGPWAAILVSGVIWGLWHAPVILLGYNYPGTPGWLALLAMCGFCTVMGAVFGWLRLRSGSVWPAALAHSALNASASFFLVFAAAGSAVDPVHTSILGWSGWLLPAALVVVLVFARQFRPRIPAASSS